MARILLLEDNSDMLEAIAEMLEIGGHEVVKAENGLQGLSLLKNTMPDMIFSDVGMPEMDGLTFLKRLREHTRYVPCVMISGSDEDRESSIDSGADGFLLKPFRHDQLFDILERHTGN